MFLSDIFFETMTALLANKARTSLTVLGIVIGIGSVVAMVAIGTGAETSVRSRIQSIGANLLMIRPGSAQGPGQNISQGQGSAVTLSMSDVEALQKNVDSIGALAPVVSKSFQVVAEGNNTRTSVVGTAPEYVSVRNVTLATGNFFSDEQDRRLAKVAVLGSSIVDELFPDQEEIIGRKIRINGIDFTVIGTALSKGGSGFGSDDDSIFVPIGTAMQYLSGDDSLSLVNITISNEADMAIASEEISTLLRERHRIAEGENSDFRVMNQSDIVETAISVTSTFTLLLGAIAGISLVVGGIGIMNMMLTTVTERTREIGLRKAIGARRRDVNRQFLAEATILTLLGGIIGVFVGWVVAQLFSVFGGIVAEISFVSVLLAFVVSAGIGILFGWYPARRAARMNPIDALRYE